MAARISTLVVKLQADTAGFIASLDKSRTLATTFGVAVGTVMGNVAMSVANMAKDAALSLPRLIGNSIDLADSMGKMAQKAGVSTEAFSTLAYAAELSEVSSEQLVRSLGRLSKEMVAHGDGTVDARDKMIQLADEFAAMPDGAQKTARAMALFGKSVGQDLIPFLNQGGAAMRILFQDARDFGREISGATAKAADQFNDNMQRLKGVVTGLGLGIAGQLIPTMSNLSDELVKVTKDSGLMKSAAEGIATALLAGGVVIARLVATYAAYRVGVYEATLALERWGYALNLVSDKELGETTKQLNKATAAFHSVYEVGVGLEKVYDNIGNAATVAATKTKAAAVEAANGLKVLVDAAKSRRVSPVPVPGMTSELDFSTFYIDMILAQQQEAQDKIIRERETFDKRIENMSALASRGLQDELAVPWIGLDKEVVTVSERLKGLPKISKDVESAFQSMAHSLSSGFEEAILHAKGFKDILAGILQDLARLAIRATLTGENAPLGKLFAGMGTWAGGLMGKAGGGGVSAGSAYMVGERGPELFVPNSAGRIMPNGSGMGGNTVIYNVDARGAAPGVEQGIRSMLQSIQNDTVKKSVAAVRDMQLRSA